MRSLILLVTCTLVLLCSCHPERPSGVISEGKMEAILYDYHLAQSIADNTGDSADYCRYAYIQKVFDKHGVTEAEFDSSMVWYSANTSYLYKIYSRLDERLTAEASRAGVSQATSAYSQLSADGDSANIWSGGKLIALMQDSPEYIHSFCYLPDSSFHTGDEFVFHGNTRFLQRDGNRNAAVALYVRYKGDSVTTQTQMVRMDTEIDLKLKTDTSLVIKEIGGFVCYLSNEVPDDMIRRLFIIDPVLVRIHHYYEPIVPDTLVADTIVADTLATDTAEVEVVVPNPMPIKERLSNDKRRIQPRRQGRRPNRR